MYLSAQLLLSKHTSRRYKPNPGMRFKRYIIKSESSIIHTRQPERHLCSKGFYIGMG